MTDLVPVPAPTVGELETLRARSARDRLAQAWWESFEDDSPNTAKRYRHDITSFFGWADANGYDVFAMIPWHVQEYRRWLAEPDRVQRYKRKTRLSDSTIAGRIAAISSFYQYAQEQAGRQGFVPNPAKGIRRPRTSRESQTAGLTMDQVKAILAETGRRSNPRRDYALVLLLVTVGLRVTEVCDLDTGDLTRDAGEWVLNVVRKGHGNTKTFVTCPEPTARALRRYMRGRHHGGAMFLGNDGTRMTRRQAAHWVASMARAALGAEAPTVTPHVFRHTATTLALSAGVPIRDVQVQMGHASTETTARYDRANRRRDNPAAKALGSMFDDGLPDEEAS